MGDFAKRSERGGFHRFINEKEGVEQQVERVVPNALIGR